MRALDGCIKYFIMIMLIGCVSICIYQNSLPQVVIVEVRKDSEGFARLEEIFMRP